MYLRKCELCLEIAVVYPSIATHIVIYIYSYIFIVLQKILPGTADPSQPVSLSAALSLHHWSQAGNVVRASYSRTRRFPPEPITSVRLRIPRFVAAAAACLRTVCVPQFGRDARISADRPHNRDFLLWKVSPANSNRVGANYVSRRAPSSAVSETGRCRCISRCVWI